MSDTITFAAHGYAADSTRLLAMIVATFVFGVGFGVLLGVGFAAASSDTSDPPERAMTHELIRLVTVGDSAFGAVREADGTIRVGVSGNLITFNRDTLKAIVLDQLEIGAGMRVILDLTRTTYVDAAGLGVIVSLSKKLTERGATMAVAGLNEDLTTLFELTKLDRLLTFIPRIPDAVSYHVGPADVGDEADATEPELPANYEPDVGP